MNNPSLTGVAVGSYRIEHMIGRGASADVYRAWDSCCGRPVAMKILRTAQPGSTLWPPGADEARWLERCRHPHVAAVYDVGHWNGRDYLAMELMEETLDVCLQRRPTAMSAILRMSNELLSGLAAAHHAGVLHRDLKPANVGIGFDGRIKLLDFGVATPVAVDPDATTSGGIDEVIGSVPYMAPEVLQGERATTRSDLYSAGVLIYELMTGERPFRHAQMAGVIAQVLLRHPVAPSRVAPEVPDFAEEAILRALSKLPGHRFATADEMLRALQHVYGPERRPTSAFDLEGRTACC